MKKTFLNLSIILVVLLATAAMFIGCDYLNDSVRLPANSPGNAEEIAAAPPAGSNLGESPSTPEASGNVTVIFSAGSPDARGHMNNDVAELGLYRFPDCRMTCDTAAFGGWMTSLDGLIYQPGDLITLTDTTPLVLTAVWVSPEYQVKIIEGTENGKTDSVYSVKASSAFTLPTPAAVEGYRFTDWLEESTNASYQPGDTVIITNETTFCARYEQIQCRVRFDANGGNGDMSSVTVAYGDFIVLPECNFNLALHYFDGWLMPDNSIASSGTSVLVKSDMVLSASWQMYTRQTWTRSATISYEYLFEFPVSLDIETLLNRGFQSYRIKLTQLTQSTEGRSLPGVDIYSARPGSPSLFEMDLFQAATYGKAGRVIDSDDVANGLEFGKTVIMYSNTLSLADLLNSGSTIYVHEKARAAYPLDVGKNKMDIQFTLEIEVF